MGPPVASSPERLVRIPRDLLHVELDDLPDGLVRDGVRSLLADLPWVPDASHSAQLIGPREVSLPALAVLARRVGHSLRDANLAIAHDRARLRRERQKLIFVDATTLEAVLANRDPNPAREAALFLHGSDSGSAWLDLLAERERAGLVSFVAATCRVNRLSHWRIVDLAIAEHGGRRQC